jgi:hypothetical protein
VNAHKAEIVPSPIIQQEVSDGSSEHRARESAEDVQSVD